MSVTGVNEDIFGTWRSNKFVVADPTLFDDEQILIILTDFTYWLNNGAQLSIWCHENRCTVKGMTVEVPDQQTLSLFTLRWS